MLYTSGTTGRPKGVLWPARAGVTPEMALAGSRSMFTRRGMSNGGVSLVCGPLYHGAPGAQGLQALHWDSPSCSWTTGTPSMPFD